MQISYWGEPWIVSEHDVNYIMAKNVGIAVHFIRLETEERKGCKL